MSDEFVDGDEARERIEEMQAESVGPVGTSMMMGIGSAPLPILKVVTNEKTAKVFDAHTVDGALVDLVVGSQWGMLKLPEDTVRDITMVLILDWPDLDAEFCFLLSIAEHRNILEMVVANGGIVGISPDAPLDLNRLLFADDLDIDLVKAALEVSS